MKGRHQRRSRLSADMPSKRGKGGRDAAIARVAARQHGVITTGQLVAMAVSRSSIRDRVRGGRLHAIHRGVYAVGHARLSDHGRWMAGVLACGDGAVLSHRSAAELCGIRRRARRPSAAGGREAADVTVPGTAGRKRRPGIVLHRSSTLTTSDCTRRDGIPVTTPTRTIADLRSVVSGTELARAIREAEFLGLPSGDDGDTEGEPWGTDRARTQLEKRMLALCRRHRLLHSEVNVNVDRFEVVFLWRDQCSIVEVDGWESHRTRSAFEGDRARDARLKVLGYEVLRFTWWQVTTDARQVARTIRALLGRASR